jgi:hypothetical protein
MEIPSIVIVAIIGSGSLTYILTRFFERKKYRIELEREQADTGHIKADEQKLLAEARQINVETDNMLSDAWKKIADNLKTERDKAIERIKELDIMLENEQRLNELKEEKLTMNFNAIINDLRRQLHAERERYDNKITEIVKEILSTKIKQNAE